MCGIFAYSGSRQVKDVLIEGLKKLEYRGYDSSGVAFVSKDTNKVHCIKTEGDISRLEQLFVKKEHQGFLGIGHTRWATHGTPTTNNAHPHQAGPIYLVHNGIIENEDELKSSYKLDKHLTSQTDTEVVAHLLLNFYQKNKQDFVQACLQTMKLLKGAYAIVCINQNFPDEIFAFKKGPPLLLCRGDKELFISSDIHSVSEYTEEVIFLGDDEVLHIKNQDFKIYDSSKKEVKKSWEKITKSKNSSDKGMFPHFMLKEIFEQPVAISRIIDKHVDKTNKTINFCLDKQEDMKSFNETVKKSSGLLILACGSSYFAGLFAKYLIEDAAGFKVDVEIASEFIYRRACIPKGTLVLCISQSGETADTLTAVQKVRKEGCQVLSLCNHSQTSLSRLSDYNFLMHAGQEIGVASTKSFSSSLVALSFLGMHLASVRGTLKGTESELVQSFLTLPSYLEETLNSQKFFIKNQEELKKFSGFLYLGRELYYPVALEGALKLKEVAYVHAEGYASGELKHGPLALIDKNIAALVLLPDEDILYRKTLTNLKEVRSREACVICIGGSGDLSSLCKYHLPLPRTHRYLKPILTLVPLQLMAYYISRSYGYDADKPRNLAKSVTVE